MADLGPLWLSVRVATAATALIVLLGVPGAFSLARLNFPGKGLVSGLLILPLVLPPTVLGYLLLQVLGRRTWLGGWLDQGLGVVLVFHWSGAVVASAIAAFPLFLLPTRGAFEAVDPARGCGPVTGTRRALGVLGCDLAAGLARAGGRRCPGLRPGPGRFRCHDDGCGKYTRADPDCIAGHLRRRPGGRSRAGWMVDSLDLPGLDRCALAGAAHPPGSGVGTLSEPNSILDVRLIRRIHAGLTVDVTLRLGTEIGVLFGPSGSGKTSILRLITGLSRPDQGYVRLGETMLFDGTRGIDEPLRLRRIGMIFQDDLLFPHLSVADNIRFGLRGKNRAQRQSRLAEIALLCGVEHLLDRQPSTLSGGERQRVGLARTLAPRPRILLCDEPVSALDLPNRQTLIERLRAVQHSEGIPVLYVTHSPAEAVTVGTRLFLLERGHILAVGPPLDVLASIRGTSFNHLEDLRNTLPARVESQLPGQTATLLRLEYGPPLIVPYLEAEPGTPVVVQVRAEDILLARGPISGLSAQNIIPGKVERVITHGPEAEALIRTGGLTWIVSLVAPAVEQLALSPLIDIHMIIKARSCHVTPGSPPRTDR